MSYVRVLAYDCNYLKVRFLLVRLSMRYVCCAIGDIYVKKLCVNTLAVRHRTNRTILKGALKLNMRSMTGYGKGECSENKRTVTIELKSVNNRYLEINSRLPRSMAACDDIIRQEITKQINRGSIDVYYNYENNSDDSKKIQVDMALAAEYLLAAKKLRDEFLLEDDFKTTALLRLPDVVKSEAIKDDEDLIIELVKNAVNLALTELNKMRDIDGEACKADVKKIVTNITSALQKVLLRAPSVIEDYQKKIRSRVETILQNTKIDESKLLNEVAFFADKADINEEISRLTSHINQFLEVIKGNEPQGRKLDFLTQEMNREINTIGSKCSDIELTNLVLFMKNELEKIKEQIRNIE